MSDLVESKTHCPKVNRDVKYQSSVYLTPNITISTNIRIIILLYQIFVLLGPSKVSPWKKFESKKDLESLGSPFSLPFQTRFFLEKLLLITMGFVLRSKTINIKSLLRLQQCYVLSIFGSMGISFKSLDLWRYKKTTAIVTSFRGVTRNAIKTLNFL